MDYREAAQRLRSIFEGVRAAGAGAGGAARCGACAALAELQARVRDVSDAVILVAPPEATLDAAVETDSAIGSHDAGAQVATESCESSMQTDDDAPRSDAQLRTLVDELRSELADTELRHEDERKKLSDLIR